MKAMKFSITDDLKARLAARALREDSSESRIIRQALYAYLDHVKGTK